MSTLDYQLKDITYKNKQMKRQQGAKCWVHGKVCIMLNKPGHLKLLYAQDQPQDILV